MDSVPPWRAQAVITLSNLDHRSSCAHPERKVSLTRDQATTQIGRTSKRNSTFEALATNCWFDSAVMSREHAQLRFDAKDQKIYITDSGSLHGTFLNEHPLTPHESQELRDGDVLRFGIPIERGRDVYNPFAMEVAIRYGGARYPLPRLHLTNSAYTPARLDDQPTILRVPDDQPTIFRVPDDTDVEDVSGDEDTAVQHSTKLLQEHNIRPARSPAGSNTISIDLTGNDQNQDYNAGSEKFDELPMTKSISLEDTTSSQDPAHIDLTSQHDDICLETEGIETEEILDQAKQQNPNATIQDVEDEMQQPVDITEVFDESEEADIHLVDENDSEIDSVSEIHSSTSESDILEHASPSESSCLFIPEDEFDDSDLGESEGFSCSDHEYSLEDRHSVEVEGGHEKEEAAASPTSLATPESDHHLQVVVAPDSYQTIPPQCLWTSPLPSMMAELPKLPALSQSSGTMPLPDQTNVRLPSIFEGMPDPCQYRLRTETHSRAEVMGAKTGKYEYFYAREDNKATNRRGPPNPGHDLVTTSQPSLTPYPFDPSPSTTSRHVVREIEPPAQYNPWCSEPPYTTAAETPGPWSSSGKTFLSSPLPTDSSEVVQPPQSMLLDDTSAYQFEVSKKAASATTQYCTPKGGYMTIHNLVDPPHEGAQSLQTPSINKRKANQISELTPEEQECETQPMSLDVPVESSNTEAPSATSPSSEQQGLGPVTHDTFMLGCDLTRPGKRLRRMAEVVGIAALGGAFVMSALIATAPAL